MTADCIDLVDKDDARRVLLRLLEHVADTTGTDTDEHLDEIRTGNGEERHLGFTCNRLGQQRLTSAGRADHQHTTRNATAETLKLARITQELDQLVDFFLRLIAAGDVSKGRLDLILGKQARLALAETHRPTLATRTALHLPHEKHEYSDDHQNREAGNEKLGPDTLLLRLLALDQHIVVEQITDQTIILNRRANGLEGIAFAALADDHETIDRHTLDAPFLDLLEEVGIAQRLRLAGAGEVVHHRDQDGGDDQPQNQVFCHVVQINYPLEQTRCLRAA